MSLNHSLRYLATAAILAGLGSVNAAGNPAGNPVPAADSPFANLPPVAPQGTLKPAQLLEEARAVFSKDRANVPGP
ncbi:MAG: hypothetical protein LBR07_04910, partial [Puniceicoccales bacterium]|nr:hypothetical protein [Puniceicoccales bacterium]